MHHLGSLRATKISSVPSRLHTKPEGRWTPEEVAREERASRERARRDREKTPAERLEETIRLSKFIDELREGMPDDVRTR
jgi:hypothetical protein